MIVVLLILHGLLAVALLGAITHQALSVLSMTAPAGDRWSFIHRFRGVDGTAYTMPIVVLFALTTLGGALIYPPYRVDVRPALVRKTEVLWHLLDCVAAASGAP